jgi:oligopeptide/dipeptide ABC transporter ATP-binding protein
MLNINHLSVAFRENHGKLKTVVNDISINIHQSEVVALLGESGCGKSVTALSILNLIKKPGEITEGTILYKGQSILTLTKKAMQTVRGKEITMIFQEPMTALNPSLSIGFQLYEAINIHNKLSKAEIKKKVLDILRSVKIANAKDILKSFSYELSGGLRQRIMIAMALINAPSLLIADEPTTALDVTIQAEILKLLIEKKEEKKLSMLFISHDLGVVSNISDRIYVMYAGKIVETATNDELFKNPMHPYTKALIKAYPKKVNKSDNITLYSLRGNVIDDLENISKGCVFKERCDFAKELCFNKVPELFKFQGEHYSACFKSKGII